jgi:hypothetical protein
MLILKSLPMDNSVSGLTTAGAQLKPAFEIAKRAYYFT